MVPEPTPFPTADQDAQSDRAVLEELIDTGMALQRVVRAAAQATFEADTAPGAKPGASAKPLREYATAFERIARTVRRTLLLKQRLADTHRAAGQKRTAARKRVRGAVEDRIRAEGLKPEQAERLRDELDERLESPELDEELGHRDVGDIIADIRRDLHLDHVPGLPLSPGARLTRVTPVGRESEAHPTTPGAGAANRSPAPLAAPPGPNPGQPPRPTLYRKLE